MTSSSRFPKTSHSSDNKFPLFYKLIQSHFHCLHPRSLIHSSLLPMHMRNRAARSKVQALSSTVWLSTKPQNSLCLSEPSSPAFHFLYRRSTGGTEDREWGHGYIQPWVTFTFRRIYSDLELKSKGGGGHKHWEWRIRRAGQREGVKKVTILSSVYLRLAMNRHVQIQLIR